MRLKKSYASDEPVKTEIPPIDKGPLPPVDFVKHWIAMFGSFADGKIEKSKVMTPDDLTADDLKYLVGAGIAIDKIAAQYNTTEKQVTAGMVDIGLLAAPPDDEGEVWFKESQPFIYRNTNPILRVAKTNITLNSSLYRRMDGAQYVQLAVTPNNQVKMKITPNGLQLKKTNKTTMGMRVSCAALMRLLIKRGVQIPAAFTMTLDPSSGCWIGVIEDGKKGNT